MYGKGRISAAGFDRWLRVSMLPLPQVADFAGKHGRQVGFPVISGADPRPLPAINRRLSPGVALREIPIPPPALDPAWLSGFRTSLELADLAPATVAGYLKDVRQFLSGTPTRVSFRR